MASLTTIIRYEILLFLGLLALIVFFQMLTGRMNTHRLLYSKERAAAGTPANRKTKRLSPSRIQLLIVSIGVAIYLLAEIVREPSQLPEIPIGLLLLMAGSEIIYLTRKARNLGSRKSSNSQT